MNTRILAVNDYEFFLEFLGQHIENSNLPIFLDKAIDGKEAVEKAKKEKYDAILMNLEMPIKDGWQATKEIRALGITTPIIAWSCHDKYSVFEGCIEVGMNDYAEIGIDHFLKEIFNALERVGVKVSERFLAFSGFFSTPR